MSQSEQCWVLTPGEAGMRSQALGLAEAVGLPVEERRIALGRPWSWLPGGLVPVPLTALCREGARLEPPWPRLVVSCGHRAIAAALAVKRLSGRRTFSVHIQHPELAAKKFDMVAAMPHDRVSGPNVVTVATALHRVTEAHLQTARTKWQDRLAPGGRPIGVLLGGDNGGYRLTHAVLRRLANVLEDAHRRLGCSACITPSRRTGADARRTLGEMLAGRSWADLWDEAGENPYLGILALSERLIVTGESISMISEALATGRPVHVLPLEGRGRRHGAFLERIWRDGLVSLIESDALDWGFAGQAPLNATAEVAALIRARLSRQ